MEERSLADLNGQENVRIRALQGPSEICARLQDYGFTPGSMVKLFARTPLGGPLAFDLRGGRVALRRSDAECVLCE